MRSVAPSPAANGPNRFRRIATLTTCPRSPMRRWRPCGASLDRKFVRLWETVGDARANSTDKKNFRSPIHHFFPGDNFSHLRALGIDEDTLAENEACSRTILSRGYSPELETTGSLPKTKFFK